MKIHHHPACYHRPPMEYGKVPKGDIVKVGPNTYQTHRYRIEVKKGQVQVFDLKTKTHVKAWGDPHLHTSDGDKMQFHRDNVTLDLEDGTKITLKPTKPDARGISLVDGVQIMTPKGGGAMVTNISGPGGPKGRMVADSAKLDRMWADGTVLEARGEIDDLFFKAGKEIVGKDPSQRWGEHLLDGKGGRSDISFDRPIGQMDLSRILGFLQNMLFRRMNPTQLKELISRIDELLRGNQFQNPLLPPSERPANFGSLPKLDQVLRPLLDLQSRAVGEFGRRARTNGSSSDFGSEVRSVLGGISNEIQDLKNKLKDPNLSADQKQMIGLELQEKLQQRTQLVTLLTNIAKTEHEQKMAIIRNLRVQ